MPLECLPSVECPIRGFERAIQIFDCGVPQPPDPFTGSGVLDILLTASAASDELAVDIQAQVFVHGFTHRYTKEVITAFTTPTAPGCERS
jgi:hypothetical protein